MELSYRICGQGIVDQNAAVSKIKNLTEGLHAFELKVTDNDGLSSKDTMTVTVLPPRPVINLQLIPIGTLYPERKFIATASSGDKIFFAGGSSQDGTQFFSAVNIYNYNTGDWSTAELSEPRIDIGAITTGNKVLFAGGTGNEVSPWDYDIDFSTRMDLYDVNTNTWSATELPISFNYVSGYYGFHAAVDNIAFFYSLFSVNAYTYNITTGQWSSSAMNLEMSGAAAASVENKILIAMGSTPSGYSKSVVFYNTTANSWSLNSSLSEARGHSKAATLGSKIFFAGGVSSEGFFSGKVDMYDNATNSWSSGFLSRPAMLNGAAVAGQKILFFEGSRVDIYDNSSGEWAVAELNQIFSEASSFITAGDNIYVLNGNTVWRVQL